MCKIFPKRYFSPAQFTFRVFNQACMFRFAPMQFCILMLWLRSKENDSFGTFQVLNLYPVTVTQATLIFLLWSISTSLLCLPLVSNSNYFPWNL